jgi:hypothetical protein
MRHVVFDVRWLVAEREVRQQARRRADVVQGDVPRPGSGADRRHRPQLVRGMAGQSALWAHTASVAVPGVEPSPGTNTSMALIDPFSNRIGFFERAR